MNRTVFVSMGIFGVALFTVGIFLNLYPVKSPVFRRRKELKIKDIANSRFFRLLTGWVTQNKNSRIYRVSKSLLHNAEVDMDIQTLYLYKVVCLALTAVILIIVRWTNIGVTKVSIISNSGTGINLFNTVNAQDYKYNFSIYKAVLTRIGEKSMEKLDDNKKLEAVKLELLNQGMGNSKESAEERAKAIVRAFNSINRLRIIDWKTILIIFISFFLPEVIFVLRRVLLNSKYRKEVVKLENIFELLGSIRGFKTIYILKEMSNSSKVCGRRLKHCVEGFQRDREQALEELRKSIPNRKFSKLVDVIRVYSMVDKNLAMEVLERNRLEKEEEMLMTSEEDIDIVDVIAFISVTPIIFELGNLLMKPMMDLVFQTFNVL